MNTCCNPPASAEAAEPSARKPYYVIDGNDEACTVNIEMPGVTKDGLKLDFDKGVLTVEGRRQSTLPETWKPLHRELNDLGYVLRLRVNTPIDEDKINARLADGVLSVTLPVKSAAKPRRIEVN